MREKAKYLAIHVDSSDVLTALSCTPQTMEAAIDECTSNDAYGDLHNTFLIVEIVGTVGKPYRGDFSKIPAIPDKV